MQAIGKCVIKDATVTQKQIGRQLVNVQTGLVAYGDEIHRLEIKLQQDQPPYPVGQYRIDTPMVPGKFGPSMPFCIPLIAAKAG